MRDIKLSDKVYNRVKEICENQKRESGASQGVATNDLATELGVQRANLSCILNTLVGEGKLEKTAGKPVLYKIRATKDEKWEKEKAAEKCIFDDLVGASGSHRNAIKQAKAAVTYPVTGLHTLILGETGVGKSLFAELMFYYAQEIGRIKPNSPFVSFNCADYANNPQLLLSQLFGIKKGSYTGADKDRDGLVKKANGGILFLDEVHRLPAEGQELLFYLMDKGLYRRLGDVDTYSRAEVLIICATTESVESSLLKTFVRRIPMVIKLPALREMTIYERWQLIQRFFSQETQYLKTSITIIPASIKAFLLYDCINNVGQLRSDIKLSCARAFLEYAPNRDKGIHIGNEDLPEHVKLGLFKSKENPDILNELGITEEEIIFEGNRKGFKESKGRDFFNMYDDIEEKMNQLKSKGLEEKDIHLIISLEIETYFKKCFSKMADKNIKELYTIVDKDLVSLTKSFLDVLQQEMGIESDERVLYGLSIHISSTLERIKNGKNIINPRLSEIKHSYPAQYEMALKLKSALEDRFKLEIPEDEAGYITMFLVTSNSVQEQDAGLVGIIVAMHGESAATSIVDVVHSLLAERHGVGYNMSLDEKPEEALNNLTGLVRELNNNQGVLMLVDMGSLVYFGDIIYQRTGIPIKTIEMVSTPMVLEATRKALMRSNLDEIYYSVLNLSPYIGRIYLNNNDFSSKLKNDVIVTACITGEGTAIKLKNILEQMLAENNKNIEILPVEITNADNYNKLLHKIKQDKNIIAVISSIKPKDESIHFISTMDLVNRRHLGILNEILQMDDNVNAMNNMKQVIHKNVNIDAEKYIENYKRFYWDLKMNEMTIGFDTLVGLALHIACVIERLQSGGDLRKPKDMALIKREYKNEYIIVEKALQRFADTFEIEIPEEATVNIIKLIHFI